MAMAFVLLAAFLGLTVSFLFLNRNEKTTQMLLRLNNDCYDWSIRHINEIIEGKEISAYDWVKIPQYDKVLFSFKPIRYESFISPSDIRKLQI